MTGGVPGEVLYDRMKTIVIGETAGSIVYNRALIDFARHYGFQPKACRPYRAKTKGKVERPYRYIREDFFLARSFRNLDDLNAQLQHWLDTVANPDTASPVDRYTLGANVENGQIVGAIAFNLTGNELINRLVGNSAGNTLNGLAGADTMLDSPATTVTLSTMFLTKSSSPPDKASIGSTLSRITCWQRARRSSC